MCINERGFDANLPRIKAAVLSARAHTTLEPHCLYYGDNPIHQAILSRLGVTVHPHRPGFEDALRQGYGADFDTFVGHWLRVDLPLVERDARFVLYTDTDVMFRAPPVLHKPPSTLAAAPEFDQANHSYFSSGVMVLNLARLRRLHGAFVAAIRARLAGNFSYPAHDQESYNRFFGPSRRNRLLRRQFSRLDPGNNWKPFWGWSDTAPIVHFHGPKPPDIRVFQAGQDKPFQADLVALWQRAPDAYDRYSAEWEAFERAGQAVLDGRG